MATDTTKIRSKLAKLNKALDELESQLEPLFSQSFPETLLALDTIQQAKLQVVIPYVMYDLVFVYLKSRGIDPKTHRVVSELERVRQYFDKIKHAEDASQKRKLGVDKAAANRFIKHAIAQAKSAQLVDEPSGAATVPSSSSNHERVPAKFTNKMMARAEYEKELKELGSEEEEGLEVFEEEVAVKDEETMDMADGLPDDIKSMDKGKGRASEEEDQRMHEEIPRRKRPRIDPFSGYRTHPPSESKYQMTSLSAKAMLPTSVSSSSADNSSRGTSIATPEDHEVAKAAKKGKRKARKPDS